MDLTLVAIADPEMKTRWAIGPAQRDDDNGVDVDEAWII